MLGRIREIKNALAGAGVPQSDSGTGTRLPWNVGVTQFEIGKGELARMELVSYDFVRYLSEVSKLIREEHPVGRYILRLFGNDSVRAALMRVPLRVPPVVMLRPDMHRLDSVGDLVKSEGETMIGGLGMSSALREAYGSGGFAGCVPSAYATMITRAFEMHACKGAHVPTGSMLRIVVVNPESKGALYDGEFGILSRALVPYGIEFETARPDQIAYDGETVSFKGRRVDAIHRFFRVSELRNEYGCDVLSRFVAIARDQACCMIQPWCELLEEKGLFAVFHLPELRSFWADRLGSEAVSRLLQALPQTWIVDASMGPLLEQLYDSSVGTRPYWLKRSGDSWGCRWCICGSEIGTGKWRQALERSLSDAREGMPWVLQEHRPQQRAEVSFFDEKRGEVVTTDLNLRVMPMFFLGRHRGEGAVADVIVTARRDTKVHGATDAVFVPARIREQQAA